MRFDYLSRETYAEHSDEAKALDLRLLWPVLPNLWLLLVTYQEKRPEFENNRYCYCCIVGIVVLLSKVSDYLNKFRLGLGRCHLGQRAYCLNVNWQIQVGTMAISFYYACCPHVEAPRSCTWTSVESFNALIFETGGMENLVIKS